MSWGGWKFPGMKERSEFQSFQASKFHIFQMLKFRNLQFHILFQSFKDSRTAFHGVDRYSILYSRFSGIPIPCPLEHIDLVFKIFKNLLDGSSFGIYRPHLFHFSEIGDLQNLDISKDTIFKNDSGFRIKYLELFGVPKIKYKWFWESWSCPLGPKTMKTTAFQLLPK